VAVLIYIAAVPLLKQYASGVPVIFALAIMGLVPAVVLYMLVDNYAAFSGTPFGMKVRFGGPAAIWATVFILGMLYQRSLPTGDQLLACSIYFHLPETPNDKVPADGNITLQLDEPKSVPITQGFALVARIPVGDGGRPVNFSLALPGYELVDKKMTIELAANKRIYVPVKRSEELGVHNDRAFTCGFYFHELEDRGALVRVDGKLTLQLDEPKSVPISQGYASAANLQASWDGRDVSYVVELPGYRVAEKNAKARLQRDGRVYISVQPKEK